MIHFFRLLHIDFIIDFICYFLCMMKGIKRVVFSDHKNNLMIILDNDDIRNISMTRDEFDNYVNNDGLETYINEILKNE